MTDKKKSMGSDPLSEAKGRDALITPSTQGVPVTHITPNAQITQKTQVVRKTPGDKGVRGKPLPRINMAFDPDQLKYLRTMAGSNGISITRYIYNLISDDMKSKKDSYAQILSAISSTKTE